jgi:hypothetical protein
MSSTTTATKERALALLADGIPAGTVANALGVTPSAITQLIADPQFSSELATLKFEKLSKHNAKDSTYDEMEELLQEQLKNAIPMLFKPFEIAKVLKTVNEAKRRGATSIENSGTGAPTITINMPTQIVNMISKDDVILNSANQVVRASGLDLITLQSTNMSKLLKDAKINNEPKLTLEFSNDGANSERADGSQTSAI